MGCIHTYQNNSTFASAILWTLFELSWYSVHNLTIFILSSAALRHACHWYTMKLQSLRDTVLIRIGWGHFHESTKPCYLMHGCKPQSMVYLTLLLLVNASDIELNPGPKTKYPCQVCNLAVRWNQRGLLVTIVRSGTTPCGWVYRRLSIQL